MKITVKHRSVYGIDTFYPACPAAKLFAQIAGTKTLTRNTMRDVQALGYDIELKTEAPKLFTHLQTA
jgi:NAD-dependent oxidoreductase involved in siderophore biosynthesis